MKEENAIVFAAVLYAFLGLGIIIFATSVINSSQLSTTFAFLIMLTAMAYNIFLMFSFQRCWNIVFKRQKQKERKR